MKNKIYKMMLVLSFMTILATPQLKAQDSVYLVLGGDTVWFEIQEDVFGFVLDGNSQLNKAWSKSIVDTIIFTEDSTNYVYFNPLADTIDIDSVITAIEDLPGFQINFPSITLLQQQYMNQRYWMTNDRISVAFKDSILSDSAKQQFAADFNLEIIFQPPSNLPPGNYTHVFRVLPVEDVYTTSLSKVAEIHANSNLIEMCVPDIMMGQATAAPNDPKYSDSWAFKNNATVSCGTGTAVSGADIKIEKAWNRGNQFGYGTSYTGSGVKIGIVDVDNFQWTHPDLDGQYETGWDAIRHEPITGNIYNRYNKSHGTWVSGIAVAKADNNEGVTGVAYGAKAKPFHHALWDTEVAECLIKALDPDYKVDILNMSFSSQYFPNLAMAKKFAGYREIKNCAAGRNGKGIIMIAASGNAKTTLEANDLYFPSAYNEVLTVGASTPADKAKDFNDGFGNSGSWASTSPTSLDVIAPGTCIWGPDLWGAAGWNSTGYARGDGTSASAPIVAGIAALILEKNPQLTAEQVYNVIRNSAEKVGGYNYNVDANRAGWSKEAGYGRVNAYEAVRVNTPTVSQQEYNAVSFSLNVSNPFSNQLHLWTNQPDDYQVVIRDVSGKVVYSELINMHENKTINTEQLSKGAYIITLVNERLKERMTRKIIKY